MAEAYKTVGPDHRRDAESSPRRRRSATTTTARSKAGGSSSSAWDRRRSRSSARRARRTRPFSTSWSRREQPRDYARALFERRGVRWAGAEALRLGAELRRTSSTTRRRCRSARALSRSSSPRTSFDSGAVTTVPCPPPKPAPTRALDGARGRHERAARGARSSPGRSRAASSRSSTRAPCPPQADLFGGDVPVLVAILTQSISQRHEPRQPGRPDGQPGPDDDDDAPAGEPGIVSRPSSRSSIPPAPPINSLTWGVRSMSYQLARIDSEYNSLFPAGAPPSGASVLQHRAQYQAWNQEVVGASQVAARQQTSLATLDDQATQTQAVLKQSQAAQGEVEAAAAHRADDRHYELRALGPWPDARDDRPRSHGHGRGSTPRESSSRSARATTRARDTRTKACRTSVPSTLALKGRAPMQFNTLTLDPSELHHRPLGRLQPHPGLGHARCSASSSASRSSFSGSGPRSAAATTSSVSSSASCTSARGSGSSSRTRRSARISSDRSSKRDFWRVGASGTSAS